MYILPMKWTSSLQSGPSLEKAVSRAAHEVRERIGSQSADLGLLFISAGYRSEAVEIWSNLKRDLDVRHLIGCTAGGVIGGGREVEQQNAVSLTAAIMPDVEIRTFSLLQESLPDADGGPKAWRDLVTCPPEAKPHFIILSDPFSLDADALVSGLDFAFPEAIKIGGLASAGASPGENLLFADQRVASKGAVGVALFGDISVEAVVAQGCRPIGEPLAVTESDGNILIGVNNVSPLAYLQGLFEKLSQRDQELLQTSLFLGILMDPFKKAPKQGDFLIRNILGLDQSNGLMAIGAMLRPGQTVQFHLRDATTSREDLQLMLSKSESAKWNKVSGDPSEFGAVLFSCVGRGA
ncbi:MAG: FIST C-terminal domain-containing protein, partial [Elusimicrobia bacterium]|nr:FIST C-terminal domain-containing protein [Elusimicrobiota bacterium]